MAMQRCQQGHYFDPEKYSACPACGVDGLEIVSTKAKRSSAATPMPSTQSKGHSNQAEDMPTVGVVHKQLGIDPVVGWLVCIDGPQRGRDYRIHSERNLIGRSPDMDICITGDETISRHTHAIVSFEPKRATFRLSAGDGRGLVYLNGEVVESPTKLIAYNIIELGQTRLMFIPFCGEQFHWTPQGVAVEGIPLDKQ